MEGFQEEFIKKGIGSLAVYIVDLIKHVVCLGFPSSWSKHIIHRIFELGIFLTQIITRLLWLGIPLPNSILQSWACLSKHQGRNELIVEGQAGFRRDNETIDHLFTLCAIIEEANNILLKSFVALWFSNGFWLYANEIIIVEPTWHFHSHNCYHVTLWDNYKSTLHIPQTLWIL